MQVSRSATGNRRLPVQGSDTLGDVSGPAHLHIQPHFSADVPIVKNDSIDELVSKIIERFTCDKYTGDVLRRTASNRGPAGDKVGHKMKNGYLAVTVPGLRRKVYVHQIVWLLIHGEWPPLLGLEIDHIDRDRTNNRPENLRLVTGQLNSHNNGSHPRGSNRLRGASAYNHDGLVRFRAQLRVSGKRYCRNGFHTPEEANAWYTETKLALLPNLVD